MRFFVCSKNKQVLGAREGDIIEASEVKSSNALNWLEGWSVIERLQVSILIGGTKWQLI